MADQPLTEQEAARYARLYGYTFWKTGDDMYSLHDETHGYYIGVNVGTPLHIRWLRLAMDQRDEWWLIMPNDIAPDCTEILP